ncbi:unnamed protein product (macronuclear) [Paramecium tetraurelia]|uniref:Uncharacterized protein n=1 Tax=Paramecium tetraurelia TaxID=5888 RepID=A0BFA5_PARTE|nr:uncharacterized protein GSPATT00028257001 [Paramecium tetraurelia]CAK57222.1 unnamed protein product [Paramecium tetraurelia]|eukprot:XP_001424620.1 hypothetical protein (macronuclear) [Paramecium tetraurelia strain d4-2]
MLKEDLTIKIQFVCFMHQKSRTMKKQHCQEETKNLEFLLQFDYTMKPRGSLAPQIFGFIQLNPVIECHYLSGFN